LHVKAGEVLNPTINLVLHRIELDFVSVAGHPLEAISDQLFISCWLVACCGGLSGGLVLLLLEVGMVSDTIGLFAMPV